LKFAGAYPRTEVDKLIKSLFINLKTFILAGMFFKTLVLNVNYDNRSFKLSVTSHVGSGLHSVDPQSKESCHIPEIFFQNSEV
jgi:hypothetical protein